MTTYEKMFVKRLIKVIDGDTIKVDVYGYPPIFGLGISVRINGIDTPELRDKNPEIKILAVEAKDVVKEYLEKADMIVLDNPQRGKYFRVVADVIADGINISEILLAEDLAKRYYGGTKEKW